MMPVLTILRGMANVVARLVMRPEGQSQGLKGCVNHFEVDLTQLVFFHGSYSRVRSRNDIVRF